MKICYAWYAVLFFFQDMYPRFQNLSSLLQEQSVVSVTKSASPILEISNKQVLALSQLLAEHNQKKQHNVLYQKGLQILSDSILKDQYQTALFDIYLFFSSYFDQILQHASTLGNHKNFVSLSALLDIVSGQQKSIKKSGTSLHALLDAIQLAHPMVNTVYGKKLSLSSLLTAPSAQTTMHQQEKVSLLQFLTELPSAAKGVHESTPKNNLSLLLASGN